VIFLTVLFSGMLWLMKSQTSEFDQIKLGMSRGKVVGLMLKEPINQVDRGSLCEGTKNRDGCYQAIASGASIFIVWGF
jgi:hypothetical protein